MRPTKFKSSSIEAAEKLARMGATDAEMADFFGVSERTLNTWKQQQPEFLQALKSGKLEADARVTEALFRRAVGYSHADVDIRVVSNGQGGGSEVVQTPIVKHYPPDTTACIFWLKNRRREDWRDQPPKQEELPSAQPSQEVLMKLHRAMEESREQYRLRMEERRAMGFTGD